MILSGYRWRQGTYTVSDVTESYAVENFPSQADMKGNVRWVRPQSHADILTPADVQQALDGSQQAYGLTEFEWQFPFLTPMMRDYLWTTKMSSGYSSAATVRLWNRATGAFEFYTATALWPLPDVVRGLDTAGGGWVNFPIRFILATQIT